MAVVWDTPETSPWEPTAKEFLGHHDASKDGHREVHHFHYPQLTAMTEAFKHKRHANGDIASWTPSSDIRETNLAYHIEMELPGVTDKKQILIQLIKPRTLVVEGKATRPDLFRGREADGEPMWETGPAANGDSNKNGHAKPAPKANHEPAAATHKHDHDEDGGELFRCPDTENEMMTRLIHGERKIGSWRRSFTLPADVDMNSVKATLEFGLLHISVLRHDVPTGEQMVKIEVQ